MSSKAEILSKIRRHVPAEVALPPDISTGIRFEDRAAQFGEVLRGVGGQIVEIAGRAELVETLKSLPCMADAKQIVCTLGGIDVGNVVLDGVPDPHELAEVDVAIVTGDFAVAENAAVWVSDQTLRHRAVLFLAQHLVLVVSRDAMVDNLHDAYQRLAFERAGYGVFISGPSKTADIEQSLVIGAHGPRSLTVLLVAQG